MKIGELATASATAVDTIRHYEREGLLPPPARTASNYRDYDAAHLQRLQFIRACRGLDMSLDEIRLLLRHRDAPQEDCGEVNAVLDAHIAHVAQRVRELRALEKELRALRAACGGGGADAACGILQGLEAQGRGARQRRGVHS